MSENDEKKLLGEDVKRAMEGLAETLVRGVLQWGLGDLPEARDSFRDLQNKAAAAIAMINSALGGGPSVVISVNGCAVAVPFAITTGIVIKAYARRQAGIPRHRDLFRGTTKIENDDVITVKTGDEFTMRGAL